MKGQPMLEASKREIGILVADQAPTKIKIVVNYAPFA
jgi:hypothetical protein